MWCDVMWCDVMWCDVMWCDVMWCDVMWCDVMWCDVMRCDVMRCDVMRCDATATEKKLDKLIFAFLDIRKLIYVEIGLEENRQEKNIYKFNQITRISFCIIEKKAMSLSSQKCMVGVKKISSPAQSFEKKIPASICVCKQYCILMKTTSLQVVRAKTNWNFVQNEKKIHWPNSKTKRPLVWSNRIELSGILWLSYELKKQLIND